MDKINCVIATSFLPNMDNVTREFITSALPNILFKDDYPNFNFKFLEPEAIEFIDKVWLRYLKSSNSEYLYNKYKKVMNTLKNVDDNPNDLPIMVISDYHRFFINLRKFYKNGIDAYFKRTKFQTFTRIEKDNLLEQIWIRCTPEDFNNPERFLEIQNESIQNELFEDYRNEICLGTSLLFKNNILCFKVIESAPYNESTKEINIKLYNKDDYLNNAKFKKYYKLASVRFNIYQDNGKYVCEIGSIQSEKIIHLLID